MAVIYGFKVNGTTYQYDYDHLANKPEDLPSHDDDDEGKVLTVGGSGVLEWRSISAGGLPSTVYANTGDVLMVTGDFDDGEDDVGWGQILPSYDCGQDDCVLMVKDGCLEWTHEIPAWSNDDVGSVLTVNYSGALEWLPPGSVVPLE